MITAEKNLLLGVRNRLRLAVVSGGAAYADHECEVEFDELVPATVGIRYIAVIPGGWRPGPNHDTSGGINDLLYGVDVLIVRRAANIPRDRRRDVFINNSDALAAEADKIFPVIDHNIALTTAVNTLIGSTTFIENLRFTGADKPRLAPAELFGGESKDGPQAGLMRMLHFHGARAITVKT